MEYSSLILYFDENKIESESYDIYEITDFQEMDYNKKAPSVIKIQKSVTLSTF